jgi:hypothetical protein
MVRVDDAFCPSCCNVPVGAVKVTVASIRPSTAGPNPGGPEPARPTVIGPYLPVSPRYSSPDTTGLGKTIKPGDQMIDFDLKP